VNWTGELGMSFHDGAEATAAPRPGSDRRRDNGRGHRRVGQGHSTMHDLPLRKQCRDAGSRLGEYDIMILTLRPRAGREHGEADQANIGNGPEAASIRMAACWAALAGRKGLGRSALE
jgi:hypothetical protein